jgi:hypothetical protein
MKRTIAIIITGLFSAPAFAQTVANGPYYALPAWDQTLACPTLANCPRFIVLSNMNSDAVLDRETGVVWERSPSPFASDYNLAQDRCNSLPKGNRKGWRLPTVQELASLVDADPANTSSPRLPPGHPFQNVQTSRHYWSATISGSSSDAVRAVRFSDGELFTGAPKTASGFFWCVRSGQGVDLQ